MKRFLGFLALALYTVVPLLAQGTGSISGVVTAPGGEGLPGVTVQASGDVLPRPVNTITEADGTFRFPLLPPGNYNLEFTLEGVGSQERSIRVLLDTNSTVIVTLSPEGVEAEIVVTESAMIHSASAEIRTSFDDEVIDSVPVGQEYRDVQKLIPGVQYSENIIRGPSAGGSGQDNVYRYDGVDVTLPLYGNLSSEPSTHDIDQVSVIRGGAKAVNFNRAGGFMMDSISKSGTNLFKGEVSFRYQPADLRADSDDPNQQFDEDRDWSAAGIGGPLLRDHLFFYASYYRPTVDRENSSNAYGSVPGYESTRDEYFGRLSFQPTASLLFHGSYRDSEREAENASLGPFETATMSQGEQAELQVTILEGTWTITNNSFASFRYNDFENLTGSIPDNLAGFNPNADGSMLLDIANLHTQGRLNVPVPIAGQTAFNSFIQPIIDRYGFLNSSGARTGGGFAGLASQIDQDDFFRESWQVEYDWLLGGNVTHDLHFGYQWNRDEEDLDRTSNGWGNIIVIGGRLNAANGTPIYYRGQPLQTGLTGLPAGTVPSIHGEIESQSFEVNDTIRMGDWSFSVGVIASNDELYGEGLRDGVNTPSGYELCRTCSYKMYEIDYDDLIQPRVGVVWAYDDKGTAYANYARYNPSATSLPRAASWNRNLAATRDANFDINGRLIEIPTLSASTGKLFQDDLDPRATDEYLIGGTREINSNLNARVIARYRRSYNFWEDTNNDARTNPNFRAPDDVPHELYIPDLAAQAGPLGGSGSSYVIAELDGAYTKYYEVAPEIEWRTAKSQVRASYTWSHYYGTFDQDNTSGDFIDNDFSGFIGSSNMADGVGRQLWDFKYGDLDGDKRHQVKVFGYHQLPWNASFGGFAIYQSGTPWETWNVEFYRPFTGSTSNTIRFSEPQGAHESDDHYQLDLNYTQNIPLGERFEFALVADVFNVFDNQTGYAIQPVVSNAAYGEPTEYFDPQRFRLTARFRF